MLRILARGGGEAVDTADPKAIWFDLEHANEEEERAVETALEIDVPIAAERSAFEESARFYEENGALFLTVTLLSRRDDGPFVSGAVTFVLVKGKLVTAREIRPRAFDIGPGRASARISLATNGADVAMALVEGAVERLADLISEATRDCGAISAEIFSQDDPAPDLRDQLRRLGRIGALIAMSHDSLSSLQRLLVFSRHVCERHGLDEAKLRALQRDAAELERVAEALQTRLAFIQDATLGLVNAGTNDVLKALSLATMAFVPPTLVASIFGMNFKAMEWFDEPWGPWLGFALMFAAPAALFAFARWRKWF